MKMSLKLKKSKGFTLIELVIVMGIIAILMAVGSSYMNKGNITEQHIAMKDIEAITTGAVKYAGGRQFTSVTMAVLCADGYVEGTPCGASNNGTAANPWGGDYKVVVNSANSNRFDISLNKVPKNVGPEMARNYKDSSRSSVYTTSTSTVLLVFGSI